MYINLAVETKRYLDVEALGVGVADARLALLNFWDTMSLQEAFKDVDKCDFHEVLLRSRGQQKKRKVPDMSGLARFRIQGAPPPKRFQSLASKERQPLFSDDENNENDSEDGTESLAGN